MTSGKSVSKRITFPGNTAGVVAAFILTGSILLALGPQNNPNLHTILDTSCALLSTALALLLWNVGLESGRSFPKWLAISFGVTAFFEVVHLATALDWAGPLRVIAENRDWLRPASWAPAAYVLPIGISFALWRKRLGREDAGGFAVAVTLCGLLLFAVFRYTPAIVVPNALGMTRPQLMLAPMLWLLIAAGSFRTDGAEPLADPLASMAALFFVGNAVMLFSGHSGDAASMFAHLGKMAGDLVMLLSVMQLASRDMAARIRAEGALKEVNDELDQRVRERTAQLGFANEALQHEIEVGREGEVKIRAQVERLKLLDRITSAIGERQDPASIFQIVLRSLEDGLPVDFACICLREAVEESLTVANVGVKSGALALELALPEHARIEIDSNGLSQCLLGRVVYEPDINAVNAPFTRRLARGGLRALVIAPLQVESRVFGLVAVARTREDSFSSGECEFLKQLSEHTALAIHQAQLYDALQTAYEDLRQTQQAVMQQERLRVLGQLASGIAHDINNALSPVALYTESLLETETGLSGKARKNLETIARAVEDVAHTVARLKDFYRQHESQSMLTSVRLNPLVGQVVELTHPRWSDEALQKGTVIRVVTDLAPDLPPVKGIDSELRQALMNLVLNAVDAMPAGGQLTLRTALEVAEGDERTSVCIEVADDGVGMDETTTQRCVEPFFTTKGERGTGLGLATVYGVVQRHGAEMDIRSSPGAGTTVQIKFPVIGEAPANLSDMRAESFDARLKLLLVDDDPVLLKSLRDALETDGHHIATANDGQTGIETFRASVGNGNSFAAVITDLGMPIVDGRKVAAAVKAASPATPVILLTGWGQRLLAEHDVPAHVDRVLGKPPKLRDLRRALADCCRSSAN